MRVSLLDQPFKLVFEKEKGDPFSHSAKSTLCGHVFQAQFPTPNLHERVGVALLVCASDERDHRLEKELGAQLFGP